MKVRASGITDIGKSREENQDTLLIDEMAGLFIVADGMGGMEQGALAAQFAVQEIAEQLKRSVAAPGGGRVATTELLRQTLESVSGRLRKAVGDAAGSTVVLAKVYGRKAYVANLGDSSAYLFRQGSLTKLSRDQSLAGLMVEMGKITPEQARKHPMRHRLAAYLGMEGAVTVHINEIDLKSDDRILLCTDGLTGMVEDEAIAEILAKEHNTADAAKRLVAAANEAGGHDNVTVVLLDVAGDKGETAR